MEKTINCAHCHQDYTYEENPKFPRKYCGADLNNCSAIIKASFKAASKLNPTHQPIPHPGTNDMYQEEMQDIVTEKIPDQTVSFSSEENGQIGLEYEIRSREVRCRALASAIECWRDRKDPENLDVDLLLRQAKIFEKYILGEE